MERCEQCGERRDDVKVRTDHRRICTPCTGITLDHRATTDQPKPEPERGLTWTGPVGDPHDAGEPW